MTGRRPQVARHVAAALALGAVALAAAGAVAVELQLSPEDRLAAVEAGRQMATAGEGYRVGDYVLFETDDALIVRPDEGEIYAITLRTPFERARWTGYSLARQGKAVTEAAVEAETAAAGDAVDVIVFARGRDPRDRGVLDRIGRPTLALASGRRLTPVALERGRPFRGSQMVVGADGQPRPEERWLGTVAYRFRLTPADSGPATLEIVDGDGRTYRVEADLSRLR